MLQTSTSETYGSVPHFWTEGFFIARKSSSRHGTDPDPPGEMDNAAFKSFLISKLTPSLYCFLLCLQL